MKPAFYEHFFSRMKHSHPHEISSYADNEWAVVSLEYPEEGCEPIPAILCETVCPGSLYQKHEATLREGDVCSIEEFVAEEKRLYQIDEKASRPVIDEYIKTYKHLLDVLEYAYEMDEENRPLYEEAISIFNDRIEEYSCIR